MSSTPAPSQINDTTAVEERTVTEPKTQTIDALGAALTYDVRSTGTSTRPALLVIGSPMGAAGFVTLASHFGDRTVVTYDPRGVDRSKKADDTTESTPEQHADDLSLVISAVDVGPVDVFASSGGAVNALALVARHPEQVRTLVAHEPPAAGVLPDRDAALAACEDVGDTYQRSGFGPAMAKFIALVSYQGEIPADYVDQPAPDPQVFGLPTEDDGSRTDPLLMQNIITCTHYQPDFDALRRGSSRVVIAAGAESGPILARRAAEVIADRLGTTLVDFPGDHGAFMGGEYGQMGKPDEFAAKLREVLD
jgi:pimeloyl-ACP methyl ester carboxylesterase